MNIDFNELKQQLYPGWTPVNIGLVVFGFLMWWPIALFMLAYIYAGRRVGLDLRHPQTFVPGIKNAFDAVREFAGKAFISLNEKGNSSSANTTVNNENASYDKVANNDGDPMHPGGKPAMDNISKERASFEQWRDDEIQLINKLRGQLDHDRAQFEQEKKQHKEKIGSL